MSLASLATESGTGNTVANPLHAPYTVFNLPTLGSTTSKMSDKCPAAMPNFFLSIGTSTSNNRNLLSLSSYWRRLYAYTATAIKMTMSSTVTILANSLFNHVFESGAVVMTVASWGVATATLGTALPTCTPPTVLLGPVVVEDLKNTAMAARTKRETTTTV